MFNVVCQKWEESEQGWGTRPDGYSLHLTEEHRVEYIAEYWAGMPKKIPDEYSRPDGQPYLCEVSAAIYEEVKASKNGRAYTGSPPGSQGVDGWKNMATWGKGEG